jgi:hypothetical protein
MNDFDFIYFVFVNNLFLLCISVVCTLRPYIFLHFSFLSHYVQTFNIYFFVGVITAADVRTRRDFLNGLNHDPG